ncbi:MAG: NifB/NifX family molybdenum-iron cluster-binding protein [Halobacteriota archaeon]
MKICVTARSGSLDAAVEPRFGRCSYFVIVDPETMDFEAFENPALSISGGAGIHAAQAMVNKNIDVLLTGDVGPNALQILSNAGTKVIRNISGTVKEAAERYQNEPSEETEQINSADYTDTSGEINDYDYPSGTGKPGYAQVGPERGRGRRCRCYPHKSDYYMPELKANSDVSDDEISIDEELIRIKEIISTMEEEIKNLKERLEKISTSK